MEEAKSNFGHCELPTGVNYNGQLFKNLYFREISGAEEDVLAGDMPVTKKLTMMLTNCIMKIDAVEDRKAISEIMKKMIITDKWIYLFSLRIHTIGNLYKFTSVCPQCGKEDSVVYDLKQVKVVKTPSADKLFDEFELPRSKKKIRWQIQNSEIEEIIEQKMTSANKATVGLFARVTEIDGKPATLVDIKGLPSPDTSFFRKRIDEVEGEVDDEYEATCPDCKHSYKNELSIEAKSFFYP